MNIHDKASRVTTALETLRREEREAGRDNVASAIADYLVDSTPESKARLFDILVPTPRPVAADENIGSIPA